MTYTRPTASSTRLRAPRTKVTWSLIGSYRNYRKAAKVFPTKHWKFVNERVCVKKPSKRFFHCRKPGCPVKIALHYYSDKTQIDVFRKDGDEHDHSKPLRMREVLGKKGGPNTYLNELSLGRNSGRNMELDEQYGTLSKEESGPISPSFNSPLLIPKGP